MTHKLLAITYKMTFNNGPGGGQTGYINASNSDENQQMKEQYQQ